jgi:hypothetical protein
MQGNKGGRMAAGHCIGTVLEVVGSRSSVASQLSVSKNPILKKIGAPSGANSPFLRLETVESVVLY